MSKIAHASRVALAGCATVKIDVLANGTTNVTLPEEVVVSTQGTASLGRVFVDNQDVSTFNNQNWQGRRRFEFFFRPMHPPLTARNSRAPLSRPSICPTCACAVCRTLKPVNVFVNNGPTITAGTAYWLVVAPGSPTTIAGWNRSLDDVSIPNTTTLKVNRSTSTLAGLWVAKSNLQELVPAYEIAVRQ